ncbi:PaaX family transcriptional regulator C-terminal domain-containing protein [Consotaella salsifontis]|uniref:Transcriptional regulator, PaaX family n=1 Tax=Consotaella salsifontis TaxID=1365950 RepID=A0A1T4PMZ3_9HYPH|nr:PaaX family transcriptional regulator C-terminal domain-containing protein [Consotaella salsifontis]SJZ92258.1 transcriptional regulator, PaaX family [Consotaella salsifontis]
MADQQRQAEASPDEDASASIDAAFVAVLEHAPPRAAAFIVTLYGDVAAPRGGELWMGNVIDACSERGISETLVRTAVSRLAAAGQLVGERVGRRSHYRLTPAARAEFAAAAAILFSSAAPPKHWLLVRPREGMGEEELRRAGWAALGGGLFVASERPDIRAPSGLLMRCETIASIDDLPAFAAERWPLGEHDAAYRGFIARFAPLELTLAQGAGLSGGRALALRLALVHEFRAVVLRDPRLPAAALPADWPGREARALFANLYRRLSGSADAHIGRHFVSAEGALPAETPETRRRLDALG